MMIHCTHFITQPNTGMEMLIGFFPVGRGEGAMGQNENFLDVHQFSYFMLEYLSNEIIILAGC